MEKYDDFVITIKRINIKHIVYGGGNIGRGFLGQLLYESGFETVFVDVNQELIDNV